MAWESNKHDGGCKRGAPFPSQKRYQIAASFFRTGTYGAAAAGIMTQSWKLAYLEALVTHDPLD